MKKLVSLLLACSMIFTTVLADDGVYTYPYDESQETTTYLSFDNKLPEDISKTDGIVGYENIIKNNDFYDETGYYKKAATELAAMGIVKGAANNYFDGNADLTNIQALTMILRMLGVTSKLKIGLNSKILIFHIKN